MSSEFAKIREDYINKQCLIIDEEIAELRMKIANGTDIGRLSAKINAKLLAGIVDEKFYEYTHVDKFTPSNGITVGRIDKINGGEVNIVDLKFNGSPVVLKYLATDNITKIVERLDINSSYTNAVSMDFKIEVQQVINPAWYNNRNLPQYIHQLRRLPMNQNEVRLASENVSLISRIQWVDNMLKLVTSDDIVKRITKFMYGKYLLVEGKIIRNLVEQIDTYLRLFTKIVRRQPFYVKKLLWDGLDINTKITPQMIGDEINCLYRELVVRRIRLDFGLTEEDFNTSTAKHSIVTECNGQIAILEQKKAKLYDL
jgi:hypothetical protein